MLPRGPPAEGEGLGEAGRWLESTPWRKGTRARVDVVSDLPHDSDSARTSLIPPSAPLASAVWVGFLLPKQTHHGRQAGHLVIGGAGVGGRAGGGCCLNILGPQEGVGNGFLYGFFSPIPCLFRLF